MSCINRATCVPGLSLGLKSWTCRLQSFADSKESAASSRITLDLFGAGAHGLPRQNFYPPASAASITGRRRVARVPAFFRSLLEIGGPASAPAASAIRFRLRLACAAPLFEQEAALDYAVFQRMERYDGQPSSSRQGETACGMNLSIESSSWLTAILS